MAAPPDQIPIEVISKGKGTAVVRLAGRRAPMLLLHRDVVTNFQNAAKSVLLKLRSGDRDPAAVQGLVNSFNSLVDQFVIESERWAESLFATHKEDSDAVSKEFDKEIGALRQLRDDDEERKTGPTKSHFEITYNGELIALAAPKDGRIVLAYVIVNREHRSATLTATDVYASTAPDGVLNRELNPGDHVSLTFVSDGQASNEERRAVQPGRKEPPPARGSPGLTVSTARTSKLQAYLGVDATLEAVMQYMEGRCVLQVASVTVDDDGETTGTHWLKQEIAPGESVDIVYVT
ncbi:MAG: hypothetical protein WAO95_15890 [Burkholderiales bacterium]